ncbi:MULTISPECIES: 3-deoxy-manno-octulosonate cytidylyltransferase [Methylosinus]|uniref:3-deoxy-manno-octulosonate cytidylyltransferase n=1 Tax=Methylosinus trichosporium (strain ATCC 35070 / NCIMB 11131 / UNIQEM 75 / OB3b) TaxID=595536 RepID=A0A2D2CWZ7_METT3|nr:MULTISPECIES: 3-deoxy-manno-octulosonate cytidylyltransferase [Methylosinus]ATQ67282.1 3-deoxy-manno-octulosonate cytidylyltransferase [Methylosinus trichosporium OB3b]OBS52097.1 3-deoxy-manno-octulosonate cytidylyltransferase [Methylosinus sp. 3S-1]
MSAAIIIPARYGSSRFPGKPLQMIAGMSMLERVWRIARAARFCSRVVIASEDERVLAHAAGFGAEAVLTSGSCRNGTERVHEAAATLGLEAEIIIGLQGDAVLTPPWVLDALIDALETDPDIDMATPAIRLDARALGDFIAHKQISPTSGTTVVFDRNANALYFSKSVIPFPGRDAAAPVHRHIGLYGFRRAGLDKYARAAPTPLERAEGLEQLRALENGMRIRIVLIDYQGRTHASVDTREDVALVEALIAAEGELVAGRR